MRRNFSDGLNKASRRVFYSPPIALAGILLVSAVLGALRFNSFQVGALFDDAHYAILAESLATGQGYRLINFPDAPAEQNFPPGWPLLLAPIAALFPQNYQLYKMASLIFWLATLLLLYQFFGKRAQSPYLELLIAAVAVHPSSIALAVSVMSDISYLFFSILTLFLFDRWERVQTRNGGHANWGHLIVVVLLTVFIQTIRSAGLSLLLALPIWLVLSRRPIHAGIVLGIILLGLFPQFLINQQNGGNLISSGYQAQVFNSPFVEKFGHMAVNLRTYATVTIANSLFPIFTPVIESALGDIGLEVLLPALNMTILSLILAGMVLSIKKPGLHNIYLIVYFLAILNFWNPDVGAAHRRFIIPLVPFLYYYLLLSLTWIAKRVFINRPGLAAYPTAVIFSLIILLSIGRNLQNWLNPQRHNMIDLSIGTAWIAENTPPDSIVMTINPVSHYLYTERKTVAYPAAGEAIDKYIDDQGVDYIIISEELSGTRTNELGGYAANYLVPRLASNPGRYKIVFVNTTQNVTVYEVIR